MKHSIIIMLVLTILLLGCSHSKSSPYSNIGLLVDSILRSELDIVNVYSVIKDKHIFWSCTNAEHVKEMERLLGVHLTKRVVEKFSAVQHDQSDNVFGLTVKRRLTTSTNPLRVAVAFIDITPGFQGFYSSREIETLNSINGERRILIGENAILTVLDMHVFIPPNWGVCEEHPD